MVAGCGAPALEKAAMTGKGERRGGCANGDRMRAGVGKENVAVFLRNRETLNVERSNRAGL
jgi:hypothetical protein